MYLLWIFLKLVMVATFIFKQLILSLFVYVLGGLNVTFSEIKLMKKKDLYCHAQQWPSKTSYSVVLVLSNMTDSKSIFLYLVSPSRSNLYLSMRVTGLHPCLCHFEHVPTFLSGPLHIPVHALLHSKSTVEHPTGSRRKNI